MVCPSIEFTKPFTNACLPTMLNNNLHKLSHWWESRSVGDPSELQEQNQSSIFTEIWSFDYCARHPAECNRVWRLILLSLLKIRDRTFRDYFDKVYFRRWVLGFELETSITWPKSDGNISQRKSGCYII